MNTQEFCQKYLDNYTINSDNTIDVDGNVYLEEKLGNIEKLPVKFGKVSGFFDCRDNKLTTLEGCPNYVDDYFYCGFNNLTSLEGCPKYVDHNFFCEMNILSTLKGIEKCEITGDFNCRCSGNYIFLPENYIYILTAKIGGKIYTGNSQINRILNKYKNEVKYLHKALSELKKI
jgi:hypothetical protein